MPDTLSLEAEQTPLIGYHNNYLVVFNSVHNNNIM